MATRLYVGNISWDTTEEALHAALSKSGTVRELHMVSDRETGRPRGFAFAEMATEADAQAAITALNGAMLDNRALMVNVAKEREPRSGRGGGDRHY